MTTILKRAINGSLGKIGLELRRRQYSPVLEQSPLPLILSTLGKCSFVQIGANDGVALDPIRDFILAKDWDGVLVEPNPAAFSSLKHNYRHALGALHFVNAALVCDDDTPTITLTMNGTDSLTATTDPSRIYYARQTTSVTCPAMSVRRFIRDHVRDIPDVLVIDTEGYDGRILAEFLNHGVFPRVIQFEHSMLMAHEYKAVCGWLQELGYSFMQCNGDTIAARQ